MSELKHYIDEPLRIFVAGPYCAYDSTIHDAPRVMQHNVDKAIIVGNLLIERGHYVFVPHLNHYLHIHGSCFRDRGLWYNRFDMTYLDLWANALFMLAPSPGADAELSRAIKNGYQIFNHIDDVPLLRPR